jgi:hypothetical protein
LRVIGAWNEGFKTLLDRRVKDIRAANPAGAPACFPSVQRRPEEGLDTPLFLIYPRLNEVGSELYTIGDAPGWAAGKGCVNVF